MNNYNPHSYNIYNGYSDDSNDSKTVISRYEIRILKYIKAKSRSEKNISKHISLNTSIVYQLINGLIIKGYVERTRKRRLLFWHRELLSATIEGMVALELAITNNNKTTLNRIIYRIYGLKSNP